MARRNSGPNNPNHNRPANNIDWKNTEELLDAAEKYPVDPMVTRHLGRVSSGLRRTDKYLLESDGSVTVESSYVYESSHRGSKPQKIDSGLGKRLEEYKPLAGPVEPRPNYWEAVKSVPDLHKAVGDWLKIDELKNKGNALRSRIARREVIEAINEARESGTLRERVADSLISELDVMKSDFNERIAERRTAAEVKETAEKQNKPYNFVDFLDEIKADDQTKLKALGRYSIVKHTGLLVHPNPTMGANNHRQLFRALMSEESWTGIIRSAGSKFIEQIGNDPTRANDNSELKSRFQKLIKLEADKAIDVTDLSGVADLIDDDSNWDQIITKHLNQFAAYAETGGNDDAFRRKLKGMFRNIDGPVFDELASRFSVKLVNEFHNLLNSEELLGVDVENLDKLGLLLLKRLEDREDIEDSDLYLPGNPAAPVSDKRFGPIEKAGSIFADQTLKKRVNEISRNTRKTQKKFAKVQKKKLKAERRAAKRATRAAQYYK